MIVSFFYCSLLSEYDSNLKVKVRYCSLISDLQRDTYHSARPARLGHPVGQHGEPVVLRQVGFLAAEGLHLASEEPSRSGALTLDRVVGVGRHESDAEETGEEDQLDVLCDNKIVSIKMNLF